MVPRPQDRVIFEVWQSIFEYLSILAVAINCATIHIANPDRVSMRQALILEHLLIFFKVYLAQAVPPKPEWLTQMDQEYDERMGYMQSENVEEQHRTQRTSTKSSWVACSCARHMD